MNNSVTTVIYAGKICEESNLGPNDGTCEFGLSVEGVNCFIFLFVFVLFLILTKKC